MNIRTIKFYVLYDYARKMVVNRARYKKLLKPMDDCVIVEVRGTYARPRKK